MLPCLNQKFLSGKVLVSRTISDSYGRQQCLLTKAEPFHINALHDCQPCHQISNPVLMKCCSLSHIACIICTSTSSRCALWRFHKSGRSSPPFASNSSFM